MKGKTHPKEHMARKKNHFTPNTLRYYAGNSIALIDNKQQEAKPINSERKKSAHRGRTA
ncbi:hypothetical protein R9X49_08880 [Pectobacterium carotovorum]|uniref:hypothetical protein n=1 Tax=Pectobacterium carotovorum TaxID=554 RepID=UPI0029D81761|nr:hypothetical protein [Pectobacterium carotovorum]MDX6915225.1 hypothetical protein [Pectobacterium carotovorum]